MGRKKRHHYIPKFYLEGFVDPNNKPYIWVYEKGNTNVRKDKAENIAFQKHYYSFTTKEGNKDSESLENALAKGEGQVAPILQKIRRHENLDSKERNIFAYFLALMMTRVPNFRENVESSIAEFFRKFIKFTASNTDNTERFKSLIESIERDTGTKIDMPAEEPQKFCLEGRHDAKANPQFCLAIALSLSRSLAQIFFNMKWVFLIATDDYKFVTSDNPLSYCDPTHDPQSIYGVGLADKNVEVTFPISKDVAFFGTWKEIEEGYKKANNNLVKEVNRQTVISALRFVFSSEKSDALNRLVQKYKASAPKMKVH